MPKNITFRDIKVNSQNVGVHINHCYQIRFESCLIRGNQIGIWGRNHFNSVSIVNCEIRRQHRHGVVIGPNVNQWGNTGIHIAGNIFEEIKGYGILNLHGNGVAIIGNYFEMVGNSIGVLTPFWSTTIDDVSDTVQVASSPLSPAPGTYADEVVYEFSVPLTTLGLSPSAGMTIIGDLGVLRGNGIETTARSYWHNKTTTFVSDIPGEVELLPSLWGRIVFSQAP